MTFINTLFILIITLCDRGLWMYSLIPALFFTKRIYHKEDSMIYYALLTGEAEGCDYTIGCNNTYFKLEADNLEEAKKELKEYLHESEPEDGWNEAILLECVREIKKVFKLPEWIEIDG